MLKKYTFLTFVMFALFSCGKSIQDEDETYTPPVIPDTDEVILEALKNQRLTCDSSSYCPEYIAKLSIISNEKTNFCQGTLIPGNKVVTSASCIPSWLRVSGASCSSNIVVSFASRSDEAQNFECDIIESVSSNLRRTRELWDNDIAVISLKRPTRRKAALLSSEGVSSNDQLYRWSMKLETLFDAKVSRDICTRIMNSYANPFADNKDTSFQTITGCSLDDRPLGATLLSKKGHFIAVQSHEMSGKIIQSLQESNILTDEVANISFATNLACTDIRMNNSEMKPKGCFDRKNYYVLDKKRAEILESQEIHQDNIRDLETEVSKSKKYFRWSFSFVPNKRKFGYELKMNRPKCFFGVDKWINDYRRGNSIRTPAYVTVSKKNYVLRTKLDKLLKPFSFIEDIGPKDYEIKFNPFTAYVDRVTYLAVKADPSDWDYKIRFEDIKECN